MMDKEAFRSSLDAVVGRALAERRLVGAVVLVMRDGELLYRRAAGLMDRETLMPMREDAVFRLASLTKPMMAALVMRLAEEGGIALDHPVSRYLPDFRPRFEGRERPITLAQLLNHTSGLGYRFLGPDGSAYDRLEVSDGLDQPGLSLAENLRRLAEAPLHFAPGSRWRYSLGLDVLGAVVERATGRTLPQLMSGLVTGPLGLADTGFAVAESDRLVTPYANAVPEPVAITDGMAVPLWDGAVRFAPSRALHPGSFPSGGAGMVGTAGDMLRFLEAVRCGGSPILAPSSVAAMMADQVGPRAQTQGPGWGFGYGWAVLVDPAAADTPQNRGTIQWGGVYGHRWFVDPRSGLTLVALTNTAFEGMTGPFTVELRDAVYRAIAGP